MYDLATRKTYNRPQALIFSNRKFAYNNATKSYVAPTNIDEANMDLIVLPDHGRAPIQTTPSRIESRSRMINGTSRSYWTADKISLSTSWDNLPSRLAQDGMEWIEGVQKPVGPMFLADNGAPAILIKAWYETHPEPFWVYLSYDDGQTVTGNQLLKRYVEERRMYFASFSYTINKRGIYDFVDIDLGLEEV